MKNRIAAWKQHRGISEHIPGLRVIPLAVNLMDVKEAEKLVRSAIEEQKATGFTPALVICDTLARSMVGGDENSARDMGIFVSHADTIRQQLGGITFLAIHHSGKDAERGMRGSSSLPGGLDTALRLTRKDNSMAVELYCEKQKDGEDGWSIHLQAEKLDLPPQPGSLKPRSSLVLVSGQETNAPSGKLTPRNKQFFDAFMDAIAISTSLGQTTRSAWLAECVRRNLLEPSAPGDTGRDAGRKTAPFRKAVMDLQAAGYIGSNGDTFFDLKHVHH